MSGKDIVDKVGSYLGSHSYLRLATVAGDGRPMAHTVGYVSEGATVYFTTDRRTRKINNIINDARVAYAVDEDYTDWSQIQGVQMEGLAAVIDDESEIQRVMGLFMAKWPEMTELPADFEMALVRIAPEEGYFLDNTVAFGHRDHIVF